MTTANFRKWLWSAIGLIVLAVAIVAGAAFLRALDRPKPGSVVDEAMTAGLAVKDLPGSDDDYLRAMDRGLDEEAVHKALPLLSKEEAWKAYNRGRNNWVVWTAGNDTLWNFLANNTFGAFDLLKTVSSHPGIKYCGNKTAEHGYAGEADGAYAKEGQARYTKDPVSPVPYPPGYLRVRGRRMHGARSANFY